MTALPPALALLADADLAILGAWVPPLANLERHPGLRNWGERAWLAVVDEQRRRSHGGDAAAPWPSVAWLGNEEVLFVGRFLAELHGIGSPYLTAWVEVIGDLVIAQMADRLGSTNWIGFRPAI